MLPSHASPSRRVSSRAGRLPFLPASLRSPLAAAGLALGALVSTPPAASGQTASERAVRAVDGLELRELGPALMGGRVADIAVVESDPRTFYVGFATGGLWKTESAGMSWTPLFDGQPTSSIGDVTLAPSNPNVMWVGTGEPQNRQSSPWGMGVFRSTDAGRTWTHLGLEETRHIARIQVHPRDPDVAWVAAVGHLWGPNPERGVYRTTDGGETWEKVLFVDDDTGAIDLAMDPGDPRTLFAATYQRRRTGFGFAAGGGGSGIWRTTDGGDTWRRLEAGLPEGELGRIGLDVYRRDGSLVHATVEAHGDGEGLYRSTDRGETWEKVSDRNPRPMYFSLVRIDPNNPERVYLGGVRLSASDDGGKTWWEGDAADGVHVDHHALWIDPDDSNHLILGNDGGIAVSRDGAKTWRHVNNLAVGQFYEIGVDDRDPYTVCGGLQDNSSWCAPHRTLTEYGVRNGDWYDVSGGDGFYNEIIPDDPRWMYSESQGGNLSLVDVLTGESKRIRPVARPLDEPGTAEVAAAGPGAAEGEGIEAEPAEERGEEEDDREYRFNWNAPIVISEHDTDVVYIGANHLLRSPDRGQSWEEASPDLTKAIDRDTLPIMGMEVTDSTLSRHDGIRFYGTITAVAESPSSADVLYVGTDDGNLQVTRDGGATWRNVMDRVPGVPPRTYVSRIEASRHVPGRVYVTFDGHRNDDYAAYAFVSEDYGESWRRITAGLPETSVNVVREHHRNPSLLFLGNETGLFVSVDRGESWARLEANLPTVPVDDIAIQERENDLVIGTHGRSVWILDDLRPLEEATPAVLASEAHLFPVRPAAQYSLAGGWPFHGDAFMAENPPNGAIIRYWLRDAVEPADEQPAVAEAGEEAAPGASGTASGRGSGSGEGRAGQEERDEREDAPPVRLEILDTSGEVVRSLEAVNESGVQQVVWEFRIDPAYEGGGGGFFGGGGRGPRVLPGTYTARLSPGDRRLETEVVVEPEPRIRVAEADRAARQRAGMEAHRLRKPFRDAEDRLDAMSDRIEEIEGLLAEAEIPVDARTPLEEEAEAIAELLEELEEELDDVGVGFLGFAIESSTSRPTEDQLWQLERAWAEGPPLIERINALLTERLPALEVRLEENDVRPSVGKPVEIPRREGGR